MNIIKFSHLYSKMPYLGDSHNQLLQVFVINYEDLSGAFIEYDTAYYEDWNRKYYKLTNGKLLVLLLVSYVRGEKKPHVWTTVRPWTQAKERYYRDIMGQTVKILIDSK